MPAFGATVFGMVAVGDNVIRADALITFHSAVSSSEISFATDRATVFGIVAVGDSVVADVLIGAAVGFSEVGV